MQTDPNAAADKEVQPGRVRGVAIHRGTGRWRARIRVDGRERHLGLFDTQAEAAEARREAEARFITPPPDVQAIRFDLIARVRALYEVEGFRALSTPFLEKQPGALYTKLLRTGLKQPALLSALGLKERYAEWLNANRTYRGKTRPRWTWERIVSVAREIRDRQGDMPTLEWFRTNGHNGLASSVFRLGHTWENLREAVGCFASSHYVQSRNGMRWRSQPEACLSNFLHARNIQHKRGECYAQGYAASQDLRKRARFDLHFLACDGCWIDVEVWGDGLGKISGGRYEETRRRKEAWLAANSAFLGIEYRDCLSDETLSAILRPYVGEIEPTNFKHDHDRLIETAHWSNADELLESCRRLAADQPDGIFPTESWLRKRGKFAGRDGPEYGTLSVYVQRWLGGIRNVRRILGQEHASTTAWTPQSLIEAWRDFERRYGCPPTRARKRFDDPGSIHIRREAAKLWGAAQRHGVLEECKRVAQPRTFKWTVETASRAWTSFVSRHNRTPSQCLSASQRSRLPPDVCSEAARIYDAARRLGLLDQLRFASLRTEEP